MNAKLKNQQQMQPVGALFSANSNNFDFELWASQVRRQMLAVLQKKDNGRGVKSDTKEA